MLSPDEKEKGIISMLSENRAKRLERDNLRLTIGNLKKDEKRITKEIAKLSAGEIAAEYGVSVNAVLDINARSFIGKT
jgi:regulator of replication initiation timing